MSEIIKLNDAKIGARKYINRVCIKLERHNDLKYKIETSDEAASLLCDLMRDYDREHFVTLLLDKKKNINSIYEVSVGTLEGSLVHPREVFKAAILANSAYIIAAHNHPSGDETPSEEDIKVTAILKNCGEILNIPVLDHIIVGNECYYSFREHGIM